MEQTTQTVIYNILLSCRSYFLLCLSLCLVCRPLYSINAFWPFLWLD